MNVTTLRCRCVTQDRIAQYRALEGHQVCVSLFDGSRLDDAQLVSVARRGVESVWLFFNGDDVFVPLPQVVDLWEANDPSAAA
jgi:hypothetical protein